jgi:hypothetical protein
MHPVLQRSENQEFSFQDKLQLQFTFYDMKRGVLTAVKMSMLVFFVVKPYGLVGR